MALNIPAQIRIGDLSKKSEKFDDSVELTKQGGFLKINAIKVYYNEKYVLGITLYYKLSDGGYLKAAHNPQKDKKSIQKRVLEIGPDDYLKEISGHITEKGITRITFSTYRGKEGTYGSDIGDPFIFKFEGHTFGAFSGGFKDHMKHLEIPVQPVPIQFLQELKPVQVNLIVQNESHSNANNQNQPKQQQPQLQQPLKQPQQQPQNPYQPVNIQPGQFQGMYVPQVQQAGFGQVYVPQQQFFQQPNFGAPQYPPQQQFQQQQKPVNNINDFPSINNDSSNPIQNQGLTKSKYPTFK